MGILGELLITFGILVLLFVVYQLFWTNVTAQRAAEQTAADLSSSWRAPAAADEDDQTEGDRKEGDQPEGDLESRPEIGDAFALMFIPRLSDRVWGMPVLESVDLVDLARGIGHYPQSQLPGQVGNFAVAGHRATNGEPFRDIDRLLVVGDKVYVETRDHWFEYALRRDEIVSPQDAWVIQPVPWDPGATPAERLITLTTCHPRWGSTTRWIWWGDLVRRHDKAAGEIPAEVEAGPLDVRLDLEPPAR